MAQHPCKAETRCKDPTKTLEECPDKEDRMLATNPECTDAHQQSNPNKKNGCDSNMIPNATEGAKLNFGDEKNPSERYLKMRAYSLAQNCQYVGEAARTQGVKGGYNADALMIADPRKARDGRGSGENPVFRYPGAKTTAPSSKAGYATEADQYLGRKTSDQDNLRQPDLKKISEFNANKNNTRTEVTRAALIKDPVWGAQPLRLCRADGSRSQCIPVVAVRLHGRPDLQKVGPTRKTMLQESVQRQDLGLPKGSVPARVHGNGCRLRERGRRRYPQHPNGVDPRLQRWRVLPWHVRPLRADQERRQGCRRRRQDVQARDKNRVLGQGGKCRAMPKRRGHEPRRRRRAHRADNERDLLRQGQQRSRLQGRGRLRRLRSEDPCRRRQPVLHDPKNAKR